MPENPYTLNPKRHLGALASLGNLRPDKTAVERISIGERHRCPIARSHRFVRPFRARV